VGGVTASDLTAGPGAQTRNVLETITRALGGVGMNFGHVDRTWFYLDDILGWYGEFNRVRTAFFEEHRIFEGLMPASTGIGTPNADGAALVAKAHAVLPRDGRPRVRRAESPWQGEALAYGSAFNRAVSVRCGESRALHISGTASIGADGELLHLGSLRDQIRLTLEVVHGILLEAGMDWENAVRGVAYFRDAEDIALWEECREAAGVPPLPVVTSACVVCWTGLLFELELEAAGP
jgi:enamine deaminase RidA (YjgF/YER057c/UK114 family)